MTLSIIDLCVISSFIRHKGGGGSVWSTVCRERQRATTRSRLLQGFNRFLLRVP